MLFNKSNESRLDILENKVKELEALLSAKHCCKASGDVSSTTSTTSATVVPKVAQRASYEMLDITTTTSPSGVQVDWDLAKFEASLPDGHVVRDIRIVADGDKRTFINSNKKASSVMLDASGANPQLEVRVKVESKDEGIYRYDKVMVLDTTTDGAKTVSLDPTVPTIRKEVTQQELSDVLMSEVANIKLRLDALGK